MGESALIPVAQLFRRDPTGKKKRRRPDSYENEGKGEGTVLENLYDSHHAFEAFQTEAPRPNADRWPLFAETDGDPTRTPEH